jgi:TatD DNase family protein
VRFVDTHCHLNFDVFNDNIDQVVERAQEAGVIKIVVPGIDVDTSKRAVDLASKYACIYAAVGIHPNEADKFEESDIKVFEELLRDPKVVAVGEIGLDFYHHPETESRQNGLLDAMLSLATQYNRPVLLHSRNSLTTLMEKIKTWVENQQPIEDRYFGVFHGFEGNFVQGTEIQSMKMAIGIGGPVTFKNAIDKHTMVKELGIRNVVLETDSPLLSPHPFRGQTNEPYRIPLIAEKIADLLQLPLEQVSQMTNQNAHSLFRWDEIN